MLQSLTASSPSCDSDSLESSNSSASGRYCSGGVTAITGVVTELGEGGGGGTGGIVATCSICWWRSCGRAGMRFALSSPDCMDNINLVSRCMLFSRGGGG